MAAPIAMLIFGLLFYWLRSTPLGIVDKNLDGIRDDVELLIEAKYAPDTKTRAAARHFAKYVQDTISDPNGAKYVHAVDCVYFTNPKLARSIVSEVQSLSADTPQRVRSLYHYSARFNGQIIKKALTLAEACQGAPSLER